MYDVLVNGKIRIQAVTLYWATFHRMELEDDNPGAEVKVVSTAGDTDDGDSLPFGTYQTFSRLLTESAQEE
jgi:hypothetical protein